MYYKYLVILMLLLSGSVASAEPDVDGRLSTLPQDSQAKIMKEADRFAMECSENKIYSHFHDCGCLKNTFISAWLDQPEKEPSSIIYNIRKKCASKDKIIEFSTNECMKDYRTHELSEKGFSDVQISKYCSCVSSEISNKYVKAPDTSYQYIADLKVKALSDCAP